MTPEYIAYEMTWAEVSAALEYIYRYVEPQPASKSGKKYKAMADYMTHGRDTFRDDIARMRRTVKRG